MRIWDVNPGYLNRQSLLGEHRELHGIVSILVNKKAGYSKHPETLRWKGYGWALNQRHKLLVAEMRARGYVDRSPVRTRSQHSKWPENFITPPAEQFLLLSAKYQHLEAGRIPLPRSVQQLWAQHKYSVMARSNADYKRVGAWVASRKSNSGLDSVYLELVEILRCAPNEGNLRNAVQHMWGYVSKFTPCPGKSLETKTTTETLTEIQRLVFLHNVTFLKESTALSELPAWL